MSQGEKEEQPLIVISEEGNSTYGIGRKRKSWRDYGPGDIANVKIHPRYAYYQPKSDKKIEVFRFEFGPYALNVALEGTTDLELAVEKLFGKSVNIGADILHELEGQYQQRLENAISRDDNDDNVSETGVHRLNDNEILILPGQPGGFEVAVEECTSIYDLFGYRNISWKYLAMGACIIGAQIMVLIVVIVENHANPTFHATSTTPGLLLTRVFICMYLAISLSKSLSYNTSVELNIATELLLSNRRCCCWVIMIIVCLCPPLAFLAFVLWYLHKVFFVLNTMPLYSCLILAETMLLSVMIIATGLITKQQNDSLQSLFVFAGLILVLDMDENMAELLPTKIKVASFDKSVTRPKDFAVSRNVLALTIFAGLLEFLVWWP